MGEYPRKWPESQWGTIPYQRANHGEGPALHSGGASKWDMKEALLSRAEVAGTPNAKGRATRAVSLLLHYYFFINPAFAYTMIFSSIQLPLTQWFFINTDSNYTMLFHQSSFHLYYDIFVNSASNYTMIFHQSSFQLHNDFFINPASNYTKVSITIITLLFFINHLHYDFFINPASNYTMIVSSIQLPITLWFFINLHVASIYAMIIINPAFTNTLSCRPFINPRSNETRVNLIAQCAFHLSAFGLSAISLSAVEEAVWYRPSQTCSPNNRYNNN